MRIKNLKNMMWVVSTLLAVQPLAAQYTLTDLNHIIGYGQSLSLGSVDTCIISNTQKYNTLTFSKELRTLDYVASDFSNVTFTPLVEKVWLNHVNYAETPYSGLSEMLIESLVKEDAAFDKQFFIHAPGKGGTSITGLNKGTATVKTYEYLTDGVERAHKLASDEGKTHKVPCFTWIHGEADLNTYMLPSVYTDHLVQLQKDIEADVKSITGQTESVPCVITQTASFNRYHLLRSDANIDKDPNYRISDAVYRLALEQPGKFVFATTMYPFLYGKDNVHLTAESSKLVGAYLGYAVKKGVVDGKEVKPLHPVKYTIEGNKLKVRFYVPVKPLVLDTEQVRVIDNSGFNLYRGNRELKITSVSLSADDEVTFLCDEAPQMGDALTYAINGTLTGALNGARGNLRDSQGEEVTFQIDCTLHRLHNWCPIFRETIR